MTNIQTQSRKSFFGALLLVQTIGMLFYTVIALKNDGFNFITRAQEFVLSMAWMGQFTLDFQCYLMLSALWIAWRNKFTGKAIVLALAAMILGIIVFAPYVLFLLNREKGDLKRVLLGDR